MDAPAALASVAGIGLAMYCSLEGMVAFTAGNASVARRATIAAGMVVGSFLIWLGLAAG